MLRDDDGDTKWKYIIGCRDNWNRNGYVPLYSGELELPVRAMHDAPGL